MPSNSEGTYAWLLSPVDPKEFEREFYQHRMCLVRRRSPDYYKTLLTLEDLDQVLGTHSVRHPDVRVVQSNRDTPAIEYTDRNGVLDPLRTAKLFADGGTLIFGQLQMRVPSLARLCTALGQVFSSRTQTNVYLTPPSSQGLSAHWDTHDVIVIQVAGSKHWRLFDSKVTLPLRGQQFDPDKDKPGEVSSEFDLEAGDMVYIPRGMMHAATSLPETSLHITIGLVAFTWADFFLQAVAAAALEDVSLRESLPLGFAQSDFPSAEKARLVREKTAKLCAQIESNPPFDYFSGEVFSQHKPSFTNLLRQMSRLKELTLSSPLRVRQDAVWECETGDNDCVIRYRGARLHLPEFLMPAVEFIHSTPRFTASEIPDCVDDDGKLTLVKRLVKEGLLEGSEVNS